MKKIFLLTFMAFSVLLLSGCGMDNTPTKKVEGFLDNYRNEDKSVLSQLKDMVDTDTLMDDDQKDRYTKIIRRQYKDMTYDIKDEVIDGDNATVTAEIEVYDYYKINKDSEDYYNANPNEFTDNSNSLGEKAKDKIEEAKDKITDAASDAAKEAKYVEYRISNLENASERVKYTIDFSLKKVDDKWQINDIDEMTRQKIHGLYEH